MLAQSPHGGRIVGASEGGSTRPQPSAGPLLLRSVMRVRLFVGVAALAAEEEQDFLRSNNSAIRLAETPAPENLEGERKTVTALFANIKGSMELIEDLDPEEARAIVDPALKLMIDAVHRYVGYVAQSTLWSAKIQRRSRSIGQEVVLVVKSV